MQRNFTFRKFSDISYVKRESKKIYNHHKKYFMQRKIANEKMFMLRCTKNIQSEKCSCRFVERFSYVKKVHVFLKKVLIYKIYDHDFFKLILF